MNVDLECLKYCGIILYLYLYLT